MRIDLERTLIHANDRLGSIDPRLSRDQQVTVFKAFLKVENERLRIRHRFGHGGIEVAGGRSYLVDLMICRVCDLVAARMNSIDLASSLCSVVALGGYGRKELAPFSDVDLLLLHTGKKQKLLEAYAEQVLCMLWDIGLTIGHCFRSMGDSVEMARNDLHSRTAMTEARLIAGNSHLYRRFVKELNESVYRNRDEADIFLDEMGRELESRYQKFGAAVCVQEPNIKQGAGGLRDLHTALWVGRARYGLSRLDDLRAEDVISGAEYATVRRAYDFLSRIRNESHFATGRASDLLTLDLQHQIAAGLGYEPRRGMLASEIFMREYYQRAQEMHDFSASFVARATAPRKTKRRVSATQITASYEVRKGHLYLTTRESPKGADQSAPAFEIRDDLLFMTNEPRDFRSNPMRMMEIFALSQNESVRLSEETKTSIRGNLSILNRAFRSSKDASLSFMDMLGRKGKVGTTLRIMRETGVLGRLIPEFNRISLLVQHDFYHKYTIDEHTLKAIEAVDQLAVSDNERLVAFSQVLMEIEDAAPLYLGILLHDIGKGEGSGHVLKGVRKAETICQRLGLDEQTTDHIVFLVRNHLLMAHLSQRRDISEESLIENFAATVGSLERLNSLLLLTYADINGVGPEVWTDWKGSLLWELYSRARARLTGGRVEWGYVAQITESVVEHLGRDYQLEGVERHLSLLPERYVRAWNPLQIASHIKLIERLESRSILTGWRAAEEGDWTELTIYTRDSAGLFATLAGTLTASRLNILSADIYTREDGVVIDMFRLSESFSGHAIRPERWEAVERNLKDAIDGSFNIEAAVEKEREKAARQTRRNRRHPEAKPSVRFDADASSTCTVVEVEARDELGLAYRISSALSALGLQITFAKIATKKSLALDVFYITDMLGRKLTPFRMEEVERSLMEAFIGEMKTAALRGAV